MADDRHFENRKIAIFQQLMTDRYKIWQRDVQYPSEQYQQLRYEF